MADTLLFTPHRLGSLELKNRIVMAPMTRSRASAAHVPTDVMAEYYAQRAGAGLIITEGVAPSPDGAGYARIPGLWSDEQVKAWKPITARVRARGGHIFAQLMHTGRVGHPLNLTGGGRVVAPSAIALPGEMYTDAQGLQPHPVPHEMTAADIAQARDEYVRAARNAMAAGFDGVELHGANGYLLEQFLSPGTNRRTDGYGGSAEGRARFVLEVARAVTAAIGADRVGIRLSPYGTFNGITPLPEAEVEALTRELGRIGLVYLHVITRAEAAALKPRLRAAFPRTLIASAGYDARRAEAELREHGADLIAFGKPFIANPDLPARLRLDVPLASPNPATFYTPGAQGYSDYPAAT